MFVTAAVRGRDGQEADTEASGQEVCSEETSGRETSRVESN